jgi:16S rRNA (cytosine967-C5)-methyltransferase
VVADARRPAVASAGTVLADVPCTGTGVLRRRADARWRIDGKGLEELVSLQREILDACADIVEEGGRLVYSTCSLEPEENEIQISSFLRRHPGFERDPQPSSEFPEGCVTTVGDLFIRPWLHGTDGAYAARLRRVR